MPKEGAPAWEILPQEAGPGEVILAKRHELGLLSNFAPTPFTFRGKRYASLMVWSFVAGFAEQFVPDRLAKLTADAVKPKDGR